MGTYENLEKPIGAKKSIGAYENPEKPIGAKVKLTKTYRRLWAAYKNL